ncbi:MAG: aminoglycoside N(3)-acetyltransferase [Chloroflexi bacterium]|nr:MAG: aminoglycoside N(3)-acetyltransferase [Chloroflexota bacterium]MBL1194301.1 aminoglycoside N(3)-acetyltransferase [Chloroflexota bacterium]NOH11591.1 AAC(3) family N-acetyltransferase [Chloroflexota bacterium]
MSIPTVTQSQVANLLKELGIQPGDGLLVHSALQFLGRPENGPQTYLDALFEVLGTEGTIVVPTFNFGFARGEDYDPDTAPAEHMGVFSEYVRQQTDAKRTSHPMQSLAVVGKYAAELAGLNTPSAFDDGSAFDRMLQLDFKLLLLGADVQAASIVHYSEQRAKVPYRYWKDFKGKINTDGEWQTQSYRMFVRDLELDPQLRLKPIEETLKAKGQWQVQKLNFGELALCRLEDFVATTDDLLHDDPWALISNKEDIKV